MRMFMFLMHLHPVSGGTHQTDGADGDLKENPATIERLIKRFSSADIVIPGHGAFGGIELLNHTQSIAGK